MHDAEVAEIIDLPTSALGLGRTQVRLLHVHPVRAVRVLARIPQTLSQESKHLSRDGATLSEVARP